MSRISIRNAKDAALLGRTDDLRHFQRESSTGIYDAIGLYELAVSEVGPSFVLI